ncbi:MAG: MFS transporter [Deltaproteobacteria bacterium]|nr:MFS transporter [Deltaproteobacteria bacterium]
MATPQYAPITKDVSPWRSLLHPNVLVAALGYMVDTYDLLLFSIIRRPSLEALGYAGSQLVSHGMLLLDVQMIGMLLGGLLWGLLGDRRGRLSVLFGSILLYSIANIANAWVQSIEAYAVLRFLAGFGLAGELGAAITLVSEVLPREHRGYATGLVAASGALGVTLAALVGELLDWKVAYIVGGSLGLVLLVTRIRIVDSGVFAAMDDAAPNVSRGNFLMLLHPKRMRRFVSCVLAGSPLWLTAGILIPFAPEITGDLGVTAEVKTTYMTIVSNIGILFGDMLSSALSQHFRSRKKVICALILSAAGFVFAFLLIQKAAPAVYYAMMFMIGVSVGFWAVLLTSTTEQFGTNLRVTATTNVPNLVRTLVIPMTLGITMMQPSLGMRNATLVVATAVLILAVIGAMNLEETFGRDLGFTEN